MRPILAMLIIVLLTIAPMAKAAAEDPMTVLKRPVNEFLKILSDPQYADETKKSEQRDELWAVARTIFDFEEISRRALARSWRDFTPPQQEEFVNVFAKILSNAYISKMQSSYRNDTVEFLDQEIFNKTKALVKTRVVRESIEIPMEYYMFDKDGNWKVYDITVEGVSLIRNYKSQFSKILLRKSPEELIRQLKEKAEKQGTDDTSNARVLNIWLAASSQEPLAHSVHSGR